MTGSVRQPFPFLAINMNQPGSFVHWSIFDVSVANLVLIAVMVVIFGVARERRVFAEAEICSRNWRLTI
jgi:hypothetical protein